MPDNTYVIYLKQTGSDVRFAVTRDPAAAPVDSTTGKRLATADIRGAGFGGLGTDLNGKVTGARKVFSVTGATNATPIVLTLDAAASTEPLAVGDMVTVEGVLGNTNANGTFILSAVSGSTVTLEGSAGNAAYTSGGKLRELNAPKGFHVALRHAMTLVLDDKSTVG